jgi:hypothetical protein
MSEWKFVGNRGRVTWRTTWSAVRHKNSEETVEYPTYYGLRFARGALRTSTGLGLLVLERSSTLGGLAKSDLFASLLLIRSTYVLQVLHTPFCRSYRTYNMLVQVLHTGRVERREQVTQVGLTARHHRHTRSPGCMTHSYSRYQQNMYSSTCNTLLLHYL